MLQEYDIAKNKWKSFEIINPNESADCIVTVNNNIYTLWNPFGLSDIKKIYHLNIHLNNIDTKESYIISDDYGFCFLLY